MTLVSTIGIENIFPWYQKFVFDLLMYVPEASSTKLVKSLLKYCVLEKVSGSVSRKRDKFKVQYCQAQLISKYPTLTLLTT